MFIYNIYTILDGPIIIPILNVLNIINAMENSVLRFKIVFLRMTFV